MAKSKKSRSPRKSSKKRSRNVSRKRMSRKRSASPCRDLRKNQCNRTLNCNWRKSRGCIRKKGILSGGAYADVMLPPGMSYKFYN